MWAASLSLYPVVMDCGKGMLAPQCALALIKLTHASARTSFYQASSNRHRRAHPSWNGATTSPEGGISTCRVVVFSLLTLGLLLVSYWTLVVTRCKHKHAVARRDETTSVAVVQEASSDIHFKCKRLGRAAAP